MRPYLAQMAAAAVMLAISGAMMSMVVATLKPLVNQVLLSQPAAVEESIGSEPENDLLDRVIDWLPVAELSEWLHRNPTMKVPFVIVGIFFIRGILLFLGEYLSRKTGAAVIRDLRADLYSALIYQSPDFFSEHQTGLVMSRLLNDVQRIQLLTTRVLADLFRVGAMAPAMLILVLIYDWRMTFFALIVLPVMAYPVLRLGKRLRKASTRSQEQIGEAANLLKESVTGVKVIQAFSMEEIAAGRFQQALGRLFKIDLQAGKAAAASGPIVEFVGAVAGGALFYIMSARRLNQVNVEIQQALAAAKRVFTMMDWPRVIADAPDARPLDNEPQEIHFDHVHYTYPGSEGPALVGIDLRLRRGEMVALVGPSGGGKTTLANLMLRFADPKDLRELTLASVRGNIGLVTQETILFDDTVRLNITAGRSEVPLERVRGVAIAAQADDFVMELPDGYETRLGEGGARLSMGQRQRLTIARALFQDPPFLVLDEATSALDAESEHLVQQAMKILLEGRGSLVIAHRLATIREADRIVVLDKGRIVEEGDHGTLLALGGLYAHLHALQFQE
jgi:subfamily B ATP-binding cassette protein MsbA